MNQPIAIKNNLIEKWLELETIFSNNNYNPIGGDQVIYWEGSPISSQKVLFCAPHALNHYRDNQLKIADVFTGSLCQLLAERTDQPGLISVAPDKKVDNLGFGFEYINHIKSKVADSAMIIDIHGMSDAHGYDICIGTGPNPSARVKKLANNLACDLSDYSVSINYPFNAQSKYTMTNFIQTNLMGDSIQIEIASKLRRPDWNSNDCEIFLDRVTRLAIEYLQ